MAYQFFQAILFLLVVELVSFCSLPLVANLFPWSIGYSFAISRIFGLLLSSSMLWVLVSLGVLSNSFTTITLLLLLVLIVGAKLNKNFLLYFKREDFYLTLSFYFVFSFFLLLRFLHPEIHWGEKPMDFTFLNYFTNLKTLPPYEPWASGFKMHYYYGGFFLYSILLKLTKISPDIGYNLLVALIPALYFSGLITVFRSLTVPVRFSMLFAFLILFSSNPEMLIGVLQGKEVDSHLFWASTRVYSSPGFTEYPFWTFLFADLHPHMMALPFVVLFLLILIESAKSNFSLAYKFFTALNLSALLLINAWDAIACSLLLAFFWICINFFKGFSWKFITESLSFAVLLLLCCLPVYLSIKSQNVGTLLWTTEPEFNSLEKISRVFGFWFLLVAAVLFFSLRIKISRNSLFVVTSVYLLLIPLMFCSQFFADQDLPWDLVISSCVLLLLLMLSKTVEQKSWLPILVIGSFSTALFMIIELVVVIDRMNSVFKFHFFLWTCFSIFTLATYYFFVKSFSRNAKIFFICCFATISLLPSVYSLLIVRKGFHWNLSGVKSELNGFNYYQDYDIKDYQIINWLRANSSPNAVIAEAYGPSYQDFSRISSNTGLATLLGWDFHISQRGIPNEDIQKRKRFLNSLYTSPNIHHVCRMLEDFKVNYVIVGDLEKEHYNIPRNRFPNGIPCLSLKYKTLGAYILEFNSVKT